MIHGYDRVVSVGRATCQEREDRAATSETHVRGAEGGIGGIQQLDLVAVVVFSQSLLCFVLGPCVSLFQRVGFG